MLISSRKIKEKMLELTRLFCIERNIFQRFVIVYRYIRLLNKDPLTKEILQKIFDETSEALGKLNGDCLDQDEFLDVKGEVIYTNDFWVYYSNLEVIHGKMKKMKLCKIGDKVEFENLCRLFSKPYSKEMLELSFKVVNSNIFDLLDRECFFLDEEKEAKTWFDEDKSHLWIKGRKIKINIQDKITNAHKILKHIFIRNKDNLKDEFFYSEIAEDEFGELEYKANGNKWKRYHNSCFEINRKAGITDFLIFNTGRKGKVKVNQKYL